jgi:hypothetical protein
MQLLRTGICTQTRSAGSIGVIASASLATFLATQGGSGTDFNGTKRFFYSHFSYDRNPFPARIWVGQKIGIYGNCCGVATNWCRCAPE